MSVRIIQGDVRDVLPTLAADSFDCIVTSPPYYGLRDYGTAKWEGGDPGCDHRAPPGGGRNSSGLNGRGGQAQLDYIAKIDEGNCFRSACAKCGSLRIDAQIGLEPTLDVYLETIVAVCRELRRVLKPSGVFFLNIGDSYNGGGIGGGPSDFSTLGGASNRSRTMDKRATLKAYNLKPKDLCLVPERLGIALQADGWFVRSRIVWAKPNPMPESVTDRPTSAYETIWMLTKSARYFWDGEAVAEDATFSRPNNMEKASPKTLEMQDNGIHGKGGNLGGINLNYQSRNLRNVWAIPSHPFLGAHFATMPPEIAERCIKAGSSERGCCVVCGKPWVRNISHNVEWGKRTGSNSNKNRNDGGMSCNAIRENKTIGWQSSCKCGFYGSLRNLTEFDCDPDNPKQIPARILDPFAGSGTVGLVADRLGRDATLIDLNTSYIDMAVNRIRDDAPLFAEVAAE